MVFHFLDLGFFWGTRDEFNIQDHYNPNNILKYLSGESVHTKATSKAAPNGIINRLTKLTSRIERDGGTRINEHSPNHTYGLINANFTTNNFPSLQYSGKGRIKLLRE